MMVDSYNFVTVRASQHWTPFGIQTRSCFCPNTVTVDKNVH